MKVALYARVSTSDQDPEPQLSELRSFCDRQGWEVAATYTDVISGTKAKRPQLDRLMSAARQKKIDTVCVWKLDRFGRSQFDCLHKIEELDRWGVRFLATTQPIDTDQHNPASRLLLHVLGAAAEFERSLILERTQAGQARYRDAYEKGQVGKTVHSRSGKDLPPHTARGGSSTATGLSSFAVRASPCDRSPPRWALSLGTVTRTLQECSKSR